MDDGPAPDLLDRLLAKTFAELGASGPVIRTILFRDRCFAGHKFRCDGVQAIVPPGAQRGRVLRRGRALLKTIGITPQEQQGAA